QGRTFFGLSFSTELASALLHEQVPGGEKAGLERLSAREREVLQLLALGHTNHQIGERLHLSVKTVDTYRSRLGSKLGLRTRAELVRYAMEAGLMEKGDRKPLPEVP